MKIAFLTLAKSGAHEWEYCLDSRCRIGVPQHPAREQNHDSPIHPSYLGGPHVVKMHPCRLGIPKGHLRDKSRNDRATRRIGKSYIWAGGGPQ